MISRRWGRIHILRAEKQRSVGIRAAGKAQTVGRHLACGASSAWLPPFYFSVKVRVGFPEKLACESSGIEYDRTGK